jgi:NAD(P)-dependent dehydrogenase (short-subunit alcohol dehydrogenase family)
METTMNKQIIITGPTSGIGRVMALELAGPAVNLVLACRDLGRGVAVADEVLQSKPAAHVEVMLVDTSSQQSIRDFARHYRETHTRLDVLINNASISRGALGKANSVDGIELTFATNVVGYYLLTHELRDLLLASAPARVVNVASEFASDLDLDDLQFERRPFDSMKAYAQSKACDRLLTWALARRMVGSNVTATAMTPGLVTETGLYRDAAPQMIERLRQRSSRTVEQGADTAVWLAVSPEVQGISDKFFYDRREVECQFRNPEAEERLWSICKELVDTH